MDVHEKSPVGGSHLFGWLPHGFIFRLIHGDVRDVLQVILISWGIGAQEVECWMVGEESEFLDLFP